MYRRQRTRFAHRRGLPRLAAVGVAAALTIAQFAVSPLAGAVEDPVALGAAAPFSVLGATGVTSTGATNVTGEVGIVATTAAAAGFPPGRAGGVIHAADPTQARADLQNAYANAAARTSAAELPADIGGLTYGPETYHSTGALGITGRLTLDGGGDPNAVFIFQVDAALNTAADSRIDLINGARAANVFWQVAGAVGTGAGTVFTGTILGAGAITLGAGTSLIGRALTTGGVTLSANTIAFTTAGAPTVTITGGSTATSTTATPVITGTTSVAAGTTITVQVDAQTLTTTVQSGGAWSITATGLTNGTHNVTATARDPDLNNGVASQTLTVNLPAAPVALQSAASYAVLGGTGVANTGATNITGDLGTSSGLVSGFPPGTVGGAIHVADAAAGQAEADLHTAYEDADARTPFQELPPDLGGRTYGPGVYHTATALGITGTTTLDGGGNANSVFIFQIDAALNTAALSVVSLTNGAVAANVFWQVLGAVGTGGSSTFAGTILTAGTVTMGAGTNLTGSALSYGTVTLATNSIRFTAAGPPAVTITGGDTATTNSPTPIISGTTNAAVGTPVTVRVAGQTLTTTGQAGGTWSLSTAPLTNGSKTVTATVRDPDGNNGVATQTLTVNLPAALVRLHSARTYSVLAWTNVVNTGTTHLSGDLGVSPGTSLVGFESPSTVAGTIHAGDTEAAQAQTDLHAAYEDADTRIPYQEFGGDPIGLTFGPGVYHSAAAITLTGTMTLDAGNNPDAVFIFQVDAALGTAASSRITLINGAQDSHVLWQVSGAVTIGATATFAGTIMSAGAITVGAGATIAGSALSYGTVTLAGNTITTTVLPEGVLSITVSDGPVDLGSITNTADGRTLSGAFGQVQVTDFRDMASGSSWVATVTSTDFTSTTGTIPAASVGYTTGPIIRVGTATYTADNPNDISSTTAAVTASAITGDNTATWTPLINIFLPASTVAGVYSATITHSVA